MVMPTSFTEVCEIVDQIDGVHLADFVTRLPRRAPDGQAAMTEVLALARVLLRSPGIDAGVEHASPRDISPHLNADQAQHVDSFVDAVVAAANGNAAVASALEPHLAELSTHPGSAVLAAALQRIITGDRDPSLLNHLDPFGATIVTTVLNQLIPHLDYHGSHIAPTASASVSAGHAGALSHTNSQHIQDTP